MLTRRVPSVSANNRRSEAERGVSPRLLRSREGRGTAGVDDSSDADVLQLALPLSAGSSLLFSVCCCCCWVAMLSLSSTDSHCCDGLASSVFVVFVEDDIFLLSHLSHLMDLALVVTFSFIMAVQL